MAETTLLEATLGIALPDYMREVAFKTKVRTLTIDMDFKAGSRFDHPRAERLHNVPDTTIKCECNLNFLQHERYLDVGLPHVRLPNGAVCQPSQADRVRPGKSMSRGHHKKNKLRPIGNRGRLVVLFALLLPAQDFAEQLPEPEQFASKPSPLVIVITGTRVEQPSFDVPASIDVLDSTDFQDAQPRVNLSESFGRVPGIVVQNRQNYAQDLQVSTRGFGARSTFGIRGVRLVVDDIPATNPDGQGQAATINLGSTERIEVLRGPFSALYGNSSGGVIQAFTADGPPRPTLSFSGFGGSYNSWRSEVQMGGESRGGLNYIGDISRFHTGGYRDHSAATRNQDNLKLRDQIDDNSTLTIIANYLRQPDSQDPLGLSRTQFDVDPRQVDPSAIIFNTRKRIENGQAGVVYDHQLGATDTVRLVGYAGTRQITQYLALPQSTQTPPTSSGGVVDLNRNFGGSDMRWTHRSQGEMPLTVTAGIDYDRAKERRKGFDNFVGTVLGIKGELRRDEDDTVWNFDQYLQANWQFTKQWSFSGGVRNSEVEFDSQDHFIRPGNPDDSGNVAYHHVNPVLGVAFKATPMLNLYANYGRGFETPTFAELAYKPDGTSGLNFALRASTSSNIEAGVKTFLTSEAQLNLAIFETRTNDEIVPATNQGGRATFQNASNTGRRGIELSLEARLPYDLNACLAYTFLNAEFTKAFSYRPTATPAVVTVASGNELPGVARNAAYAELAWRRNLYGPSVAIELTYRDRIFVNDVNSETADAYTVANAHVGYRHKTWGLEFTEFLRVDNLINKKYVGSVIVNESSGRYYEPAPGRTVLAGINVSYAF